MGTRMSSGSGVVTFRSTRSEGQCPYCRDAGFVIYDSQTGDEVCRVCGMVLEARVMSEEQEWRTFSSDSGGNDRNRVAGPSDIWLDDGNNGTSMVGADKKMAQFHEIATAAFGNDRLIKTAFVSLRNVAITLGLRDTVVERCKEMVKELANIKKLQKRTTERCMLALVYLACREEGVSRTLGELVQPYPSLSEKELGQTTKAIRKVMPGRGYSTTSCTGDLMPKLCTKLGLAANVRSYAQSIARKSEGHLVKAHRPTTTAGAILMLVVELMNVNCPARAICAEVNTGEVTVREVYREVCSLLPGVLPEDFVILNKKRYSEILQMNQSAVGGAEGEAGVAAAAAVEGGANASSASANASANVSAGGLGSCGTLGGGGTTGGLSINGVIA
eukprot:GDKJ01042754.1.p1 GENE.GDKJ01042754.1~~GDKJ01042754.1.p1  ORF type:complete len:388 (-),score=80.42 GDKJ01042754.1:58-1221(-)